jgi:hypothetical protein
MAEPKSTYRCAVTAVDGCSRERAQVVAFKQKLEVDESRKKAMDKHLSFLVSLGSQRSLLSPGRHPMRQNHRSNPPPPPTPVSFIVAIIPLTQRTTVMSTGAADGALLEHGGQEPGGSTPARRGRQAPALPTPQTQGQWTHVIIIIIIIIIIIMNLVVPRTPAEDDKHRRSQRRRRRVSGRLLSSSSS